MAQTVSRPLCRTDQQAILSACGTDFFGLRTRVILELSMRLGLLEKEIYQLNIENVTSGRSPSKTISINESSIETDHQFRQLLQRYLSERAEFIEDNPELIAPEAPLILSQSLTRLTKRALRKSLKGIADEAKLIGITFHALRSTYIHALWNQTKNVDEVARRGRLKSSATIMRHIGVYQT